VSKDLAPVPLRLPRGHQPLGPVAPVAGPAEKHRV